MSVHQLLTDTQRDEFVATLLEFKRTNPAEYDLVVEAIHVLHVARSNQRTRRSSHARQVARRLRASFGRGDTADVVALLRRANGGTW